MTNPELTRVDSRLIHGTIVENWVNYLKATAIVVANDEIIKNSLTVESLELAAPSKLRVGIYTIEETIKRLIKDEFKQDRLIVLFSNVKDACQAINDGLLIQSLNLGDYKSDECIMRLSDRVILNYNDISLLKSVLHLGVSVYVQSLPDSKLISVDIHKLNTM